MKISIYAKILAISCLLSALGFRSYAAEPTSEAITTVSKYDHINVFWQHMFDPYRFFTTLFERYGAPGKPISFYMPTMGRMLMVYDADSLHTLAVLEGQGGFLKKGYSVQFVSSRLLGSGFAVLEDGDLYKNIHSKMKPKFIQNKMISHVADTQKWAQDFVRYLKIQDKEKKWIDLEEEMLTFTMGGISRSMLGFALEMERSRELSRALSGLLSKIISEQFSFRKFIFQTPAREADPEYQLIYEFLQEVIAHNQESEQEENPFSEVISDVMKDPQLSEEQKRDQILNIFFGGHETTAHWLTVCLYFLSQHQDSDFVAQIRAEAEAFRRGEKELKSLTYLDAFMQEALRIDPSVPFYGRETIAPISFNGFEVPVGTKILISPYAAHHLEKNWPDAGTFRPERFLTPLRMDNRTFIPFGVGKRSCMGRHFSAQEVKLFLITLLLEEGRVSLDKDCKLDSHLVCTARFRKTPWGRISFPH